MFNTAATNADQPLTTPRPHAEATDAQEAQQPSPPEPLYRPFFEDRDLQMSPYNPYPKEPALPASPYQPYKDI